MRVGTPSRAPGCLSEINVTPMADIMIVLLIIFMVAVPLATSPGSVALPRADHATEREDGPVVLTLHADGTVLLERLPVPGGPTLRLALERRLRGIPPEDRQVVVRALSTIRL